MKRAAPDHPKTLALMQALDVPRYAAVGLLELLWHFTARYAPQGDIGRWSDGHIAAGVSWAGDAVQLVAALRAAGYLDDHPKYRLLVHDWHDHADDATKKALARNNKAFLVVSRHSPADGGRRRTRVTPAVAVARALPEPEPKPVVPAPLVSITASVPWTREAADDWISRFGGTAPGGRIGKALKPLLRDHQWPEVRIAWREYLGQVEAEFASPERFAATYGRWSGTAAPARGSPKTGTERTVAAMQAYVDSERRKEGT